jgi:vacuolar-type H+-ATPase subunit I/STV1
MKLQTENDEKMNECLNDLEAQEKKLKKYDDELKFERKKAEVLKVDNDKWRNGRQVKEYQEKTQHLFSAKQQVESFLKEEKEGRISDKRKFDEEINNMTIMTSKRIKSLEDANRKLVDENEQLQKQSNNNHHLSNGLPPSYSSHNINIHCNEVVNKAFTPKMEEIKAQSRRGSILSVLTPKLIKKRLGRKLK